MARFQTVLLLSILTLTLLAGAFCQSCPPVVTPTDICALQNKMAALQQKVDQVTAENSRLKSELDQAQNQINNHDILLKQKHNQVAFSAYASEVLTYSPNQVIQFDIVKINIGDGYDGSAGIFTCGDGGLYVFTVTILSGTQATWFQIVQDGAFRANGFSGSTSKSSATHVAVVRCSPGSQVWVRRTNFQLAYNHTVWSAHSEFTGFKIGD